MTGNGDAEILPLENELLELDMVIAERQSTYDRARAVLEPEIARLSAEADVLANEFKRLVGAAAAAYAGGAKAMASSLATQRRATQSQCQALNEQVRELQNSLRQQLEALKRLRERRRSLIEARKAQRHSTKNERARNRNAVRISPQVMSFDQSGIVSNDEIAGLIDSLPPLLVSKVSTVQYFNESRVVDGRILLGGTTRTVPAEIAIFSTAIFDDPRKHLIETVFHEFGHVLMRNYVSGVDLLEWNRIFRHTCLGDNQFVSEYAGKSADEDFAESYQLFRMRPSWLREISQVRYNFVMKIERGIPK